MAWDPVLGQDPDFMAGGKNYGGANERPDDPANNQAYLAQRRANPVGSVLGDIGNFVTAPFRTLFNPPRQVTDDNGKRLSEYGPMQTTPLGAQAQTPTSQDPAYKYTEEGYKGVMARDPDAQFARDRYMELYGQMTNPNDPSVRQVGQQAFGNAAAGAAARGIRGPMSMNIAQDQSARAQLGQLAQNRRDAMGALGGLGGRVDAEKSQILQALGGMSSNFLQARGLDLRQLDMILSDDLARTELRMAIEQNDEAKVWRIIDTAMRGLGMLFGSGGGSGDGGGNAGGGTNRGGARRSTF